MICLALVVEVLTNTCLTEGHLVLHAESVNYRVVLVTVQNASWNGLRYGRSLIVMVKLLGVVHVLHMLRLMVHSWSVAWAGTSSNLAICGLINIVTHIYGLSVGI